MLHTKIRANRPADSGEEDFLKGFYHLWMWPPSWSCDQHHVIRFSFPCTCKLSKKNWFRSFSLFPLEKPKLLNLTLP